MVLPAPTGEGTGLFPAATAVTPSGLFFPQSTASDDPMFGVNPYTPGQNMYTGSFIDPSVGLPDLAQRRAQQQQMAQMATLSQLGMAPESDPHTWTPEMAASQTDAAIAKIASVNPDAAERLMEMRAPNPEADTGDSFWDNVKEVAGDILAPGLELGGRVLDLVSRTANIVPNLAMDAIDGGDFDPLADIGGALSGDVRHNWNAVFQEMGWEGDGIGGFLRATVGFVGDIATDPLTWLIPAGAGVKGAEAAATTARTAATRSTTILEKAAALGIGGADDDLAKTLVTKFDEVVRGAQAKGWKLGDDMDERVWGLIGSEVEAAQRGLLGDMFTIADRTYRATRTRSFSSFAKKGSVTLSDGTVVKGAELKSVLERVVQEGAFTSRASSEWRGARQIASSLGGIRFKGAVPFTSLRYISPALPGSKALGEHTVGALARFASGQSGMRRMVSAIGDGHGEWSDLQVWMEEGFDAAFQKNPELVNKLRGRFKNLGSMFYSGSEQMGRITAHFDSAARASRTGLAGYYAHAESTRIKNAFNHFIRETAYNVKDSQGRVMDRQMVLRDMESFLGVSLRKKGATANTQQMLDYARYLDYFPAGLDTANPQAIEQWFWTLPKNQGLRERAGAMTDAPLGMEPGADELATAEARLLQMQESAAKLSPKQREVLDRVNTIWDHARNEAAKKDAILADVRMNYDQVGKLSPTQASEWQTGTHAILSEDFFMDVEDAGSALAISSRGITEEQVMARGNSVVGVAASRTKGGGRGVSAVGQQRKVRLKLHQPLIIDETADATLTDQALLLQWREDAEAAVRAEAEAVDAVTGKPTGTILSDEEQARRVSQLVTEKLRKERPDADGVVWKRANGDIEVVAFDHTSVKHVDDSAANVVAERGYFHRTFTKTAREWVKGVPDKDSRILLTLAPEVEAYLSRQTIGMSIDEAEDHVRMLLVEKFGFSADELPERIWELDTLLVHEAYVTKVGEAVAGEMTGKAARRMVHMGDLAPALFGNSPRDQKYEWMMNPGLLRELQQADTRLTNAILKSHSRDAKLMEQQHAEHAAASERLGLFSAMLEESLAEGVEVPNRLVMAARKHGATVSDAQASIAKERAGIESVEESLRADLTAYDAAVAQVKDDPGVGHPRSGEPMRVTELGDGRQRVQGWHFTESFGLPAEGTRGVDMSSNGFHFGDFDTAKARADIEMDAKGKTIGWRSDPSTWPVETREVGDSIVAMPGESTDDFIARLEATAGESVEVPIEPDVFYDDVLFPVEAEGVFKGAAEGDTVLTEADLGLTFTGSGRGESVQKQIERAQLGDADGALYANAVEGEGVYPSIVVLEPSNVRIATGQTAFDEAVDAGKVFRAPDGTVSTKRVAGSRRLTSPRAAREQLDQLAKRKSELEGLDRSLREGADDVVRPNAPRGRRHKVNVDRRGDNFQVTVGDGSYVRAQLTPEGDLKVISTLVDPAMRRQGVGSEMYRKLAELADEFGGRLVSDDLGSRTPEADLLWEGLRKKGYHVTEEEGATGAVFVLQHESLPSTRAVAESGQRVAAGVEATVVREAKLSAAAAKRLLRLKQQTHNAMTEANRAYTEFHGVKAQVKPALVKVPAGGKMGGLTPLSIPGLEGFAMPAYVAEEFHHIVATKGIGDLRTSWRRYVMGPWKRWATYRWPGFHVRNFFGAWFNNWLGGVVEHDYVFSWRINHARDGQLKWADRAISAAEIDRYQLESVFGRGYKPTYSEVADLLAEQGVGRANTMAVMGIEQSTEAVAENYRAVGKKNPRAVSRAARKFDGLMRSAGSSVEDFHRVAAWGAGMASTQGDTYGARAFVMMRHGDYADLTDAEDFIRDLVPFYKWMRTNIPYQIRMLAENPAMLTMSDKVEQYAYDAQGLKRAEGELQQPEWMKRGLAVPIPSWVPVVGSKDKDALKFAMFDLPYADLYNGLGDYLSSGLPVGRNFIESYGIKQQMFSGVPLTGEYKPLSGVFNIPGVRDILHTFGLTKRGEDGQEYMKDQVQNVLMAWPIFSRFRNFTESDPSRVSARTGGLFSMLAGVGIRPGDFTQAELDFYYNEVEPLLAEYKSLGIQLPTAEDFQSAEAGEAAGLFNTPPVESPFLAA